MDLSVSILDKEGTQLSAVSYSSNARPLFICGVLMTFFCEPHRSIVGVPGLD